MTAYVTRPAVALPPHRVTTAEIAADLDRAQAGHPDLRLARRMTRSLRVQERYFARPLTQYAQPESIAERHRWTAAALYRLGERAARDALEEAGTAPDAVDCMITLHTTAVDMPGLGVHVANTLGLRPDVLHVPVSQIGCAGGAWALAHAAELVAARSRRRVLVLAAEVLSTSYRPEDPGQVPAMYRALFGDGAAACVVSGEWLGPGLGIQDGWTYLLPHSADRYRKMETDEGPRFASTRAAVNAVAECMPSLVGWLREAGESAWPQWTAVHPGGPRIIESVAAGLGLDSEALRTAWDSLRAQGNPGGPAVLDVLRRTYDDPPADGSPGLLCGWGPGFAGAAVRGLWCAEPR
ncbi:PhlD [Streptomyces sp. NPDC087850]|uniref:PhlD n=1 Tax=Streptomyces sp. NPDC087850 TaxID=3365809 RepID=UPI0037F5D11D